MYRCLSPGAIGIGASFEEGLALAASNGFQGLELSMGEIADRAQATSAEAIRSQLSAAGLEPGGCGLPADFRGSDESHVSGLATLRRLAPIAQEIGCTRFATWISPASDTVPFTENFAFHRKRLAPFAAILGDHGCSLGLEFIGPETLRRGKEYPFIHTLDGMLELCGACGPNVGLLLDCWHWYTSDGTVADIRALSPDQVVYVHVNDAPTGVAVEDQIDNVRCLPGETGVIDICGFLQSLQDIGYDGPITPEPFSKKLQGMSPAQAAATAGQSMRKIWEIAGL